jgi:hypothetical protein
MLAFLATAAAAVYGIGLNWRAQLVADGTYGRERRAQVGVDFIIQHAQWALILSALPWMLAALSFEHLEIDLVAQWIKGHEMQICSAVATGAYVREVVRNVARLSELYMCGEVARHPTLLYIVYFPTMLLFAAALGANVEINSATIYLAGVFVLVTHAYIQSAVFRDGP